MSEPISRLNRPWTGGWNDPPMMGSKLPKDRQSVVTRQLKPGSRYYPSCPHMGSSVSEPNQFIGAPTSPYSIQGPYQYSMPQEQALSQPPLFSPTIPAAYHTPQYYQPSDTSLISADSDYQLKNNIPPPPPPTSGLFQSGSFQLPPTTASPSTSSCSLMPAPDVGPQHQHLEPHQQPQASQSAYKTNFGAVPAIQMTNPCIVQQNYYSSNQPWQPQKFQPMTNYSQHPVQQVQSPQEQPSPQQTYEQQYQQYQQQYQEQYQQYQQYQQQYQTTQYTEPQTLIPQPLPQEPELSPLPIPIIHQESDLAPPPAAMTPQQSTPTMTSQQTSTPMVPATETISNPEPMINNNPFGVQQPFIQTTQSEQVASQPTYVDHAELHTKQATAEQMVPENVVADPAPQPLPQPTSNNNLFGLQEYVLSEPSTFVKDVTKTPSVEEESELSSADSITTEESCPVTNNDPFGLHNIKPVSKPNNDPFELQNMGGYDVSNNDPFGLQFAPNIEAPIFTMFTPNEAAAPIEDLNILKTDSNINNDPFDLQQYTPKSLSPSDDSSASNPFNLNILKSSIVGLETFPKVEDSVPPIPGIDKAPPLYDEPPTLNIDTNIVGGISIFKPDNANIFKPVDPEPDSLFAPSSKSVVEDIDNGWDNDFNSWNDKETVDLLFEDVQL